MPFDYFRRTRGGRVFYGRFQGLAATLKHYTQMGSNLPTIHLIGNPLECKIAVTFEAPDFFSISQRFPDKHLATVILVNTAGQIIHFNDTVDIQTKDSVPGDTSIKYNFLIPPEGDPDEYVRQQAESMVHLLVENAKPIIPPSKRDPSGPGLV